MARIDIPAEGRQLSDPAEVLAFLQSFGVWYEHWEVASRVGPNATSDEILAAYAPEIERLKAQGGFVTADVVNVTPETPNLEAMLNKFNKEHTHSEDEIRFTVKGSGVFHIHPSSGPVFAITVETGDLINVPAGTKHWFNLCDDRNIRCIRLFRDASGWTPVYVPGGEHENYAPLCFGGTYLSGERAEQKAVRL